MKQFFLSLIEVGSYWFHALKLRIGFAKGGTIPVETDPDNLPPHHFNCRCVPPQTIETDIHGVKLTLRRFPGLGPPPSPTGFPSTESMVNIVRQFEQPVRFKIPLGPTENSWILVDGNGCLGPALRFSERPVIGEITSNIVEKLDLSIPAPLSAVTCGSCGRHLATSDLVEKWLMKEMR